MTAAESFLQWFAYSHLKPDLQEISKPFQMVAVSVVNTLPDNQEKLECLRKLLEAKDCAVRAALFKI